MQGVTEVCSACEFDPSGVGDDQLGSELVRLAAGYEAVIAAASASVCSALNSRPSPEIWSILEYAGHVEFIYDFICQMCEAAVADELASVNGVDPDEHVDNAHFNDLDAAEMSRRILAAGDRASVALASLDHGALDWMLAFNGNPAPLRLLTVAMVHESHHHLRDITQLAAR